MKSDKEELDGDAATEITADHSHSPPDSWREDKVRFWKDLLLRAKQDWSNNL